ncbi:AB-hydrolase YheT [Ascodesmis nigricans]|uniref:AB-hydrolase YheT n=1 Tax=Ascodesmis nigricans TaxID=341454 RepID=A0A4V3SIR3_9PEZI|nr:AB-hydrolase YheT [Ascodesmis nigricans]
MTKPHFIHSASTVLLRSKNGAKTALADLIPPLVPSYTGNPLLFNGHLQTAYSVVKYHDPFPIYYARKLFLNPADGGHFAVDFVLPEPTNSPPSSSNTSTSDASGDTTKPAPATEDPELPPRTRFMTDPESTEIDAGDPEDSTPMLIVLHGLTGGSHELYLRAMLHPIVSPSVGFAACVINARGCALSKITSKQLFNAKFTDDVRLLVKHLRKAYPKRPLFAVGFSLGANILTNYLGEEAERCELRAAAVVSNPWNLELTDNGLHRTWIGHHVYSKVLGGNLRRLFELHRPHLTQDPRILPDAHTRMTHAYDFDREVTAKVFGYHTVGSYYRAASSIDKLLSVRIPTLIIHAKDDPIVMDGAAPYDEVKANPWTFMVATEGGGHIGWFEWNGERWFPKPIVAFFREMVGVEKVVEQEVWVDAVGYREGREGDGVALGVTGKREESE